MKRYKAVVIDIRRILKGVSLIVLAAVISISTVCASTRYILSKDNAAEIIIRHNIATNKALSFESILEAVITIKKLGFNAFLGFVPNNTASVIKGSIPILSAAKQRQKGTIGGVVISKNGEVVSGTEDTALWEASIPEENRAAIKNINAAQKTKIAIANETTYSVDLDAMLKDKPKFNLGGKVPKILIAHTHATESYAPIGARIYDTEKGDRSEDKSKNVVAVGRRMKEVFESYGIETLHDEILHDVPSFNGSYAHSLATVEDYIEKYPSIQIVFDIHRDSIIYGDKTKAKTVTEINGESVAQLMFVVGTDAGGLEHPNWRDNMRSAVWFQKIISDEYPTLMRHINLRKERFNGHTTGASMIVEVGTSGNSLDEALRGVELAANTISRWLVEND